MEEKMIDKNFCLDLSHLPKELRLLLEIMKTNNDSVSLSDELFIDIDWELFLRMSRHHRVNPLIYSKLKMIDEKRVPLNVIQILYEDYKKNTFQMLLLCGEMELVSKLFSEKQIRLLFMKGPVIAADIYGDISLRTSKDLDILIPMNDLKKAEELLLIYGYVRENRWKHHITFFHPQKGIEIEIHWRLHPPSMKEPSFNELWERKSISTLSSYPIYFFGKEDLFLFLVDHGNRHGWFRLRWLADIDQIIRKRIFLEETTEISKKIQHDHLRGHALILAAQLFNTPINDELKSIIAGNRQFRLAKLAVYYIIEMCHSQLFQSKYALAQYYNKNPFSIKSNLKKSIFVNLYSFAIKSNFDKISFVIHLFYPGLEDEKTLRLPKPLYFLYFPLRPFLWVWRKARKPA
ncbi:nucleotidyltransferase family protein [Peribacillus simplex]|uniref:nucleotidyltransferase domain-containing protein n=1 Tax=Peribacillus simplex TaxID=1478 RepID=UPI003D274720